MPRSTADVGVAGLLLALLEVLAQLTQPVQARAGLLPFLGQEEIIHLLPQRLGRLAKGVGIRRGVLILVTGVGYLLRSTCGLKWVLVVLTFEGSIRIGMLVSFIAQSWRRLMMS